MADTNGLPDFCGSIAVLMGWFALLCTAGGNFWCNYAKQDVTFSTTDIQGNTISNQTQVISGIWNYQDFDLWTDGSAIRYTIYPSCVAYRDEAPFDAKWRSAMAFTIIAVVVGFVVAVSSCFAVCVRPTKVFMQLVALVMLFTTLFQGLTLLYFRSNGCTTGPSTVTQSGITYDASWAKCDNSHAANVGISGVALWGASAILLLFVANRHLDENKSDKETMVSAAKEEANA